MMPQTRLVAWSLAHSPIPICGSCAPFGQTYPPKAVREVDDLSLDGVDLSADDGGTAGGYASPHCNRAIRAGMTSTNLSQRSNKAMELPDAPASANS